MKGRAIVVNLRTRFTVFCPECGLMEHVESLRTAESLADAHVCPDGSAFLAELFDVCQC